MNSLKPAMANFSGLWATTSLKHTVTKSIQKRKLSSPTVSSKNGLFDCETPNSKTIALPRIALDLNTLCNALATSIAINITDQQPP